MTKESDAKSKYETGIIIDLVYTLGGTGIIVDLVYTLTSAGHNCHTDNCPRILVY